MLSIFFAGLWPLIWHLSGAGLIIAAALAWAWFMPIGKKIALWIALAVGMTTCAYVVGTKDGGNRVQAQWDQTIANDRDAADKAARDADNICSTPDCLRDDKYNRDR